MQSLSKIETWFSSEELVHHLSWFIIFAQALRGQQEPCRIQGKPSKLPFLSPSYQGFPWSWKSFKDFLFVVSISKISFSIRTCFFKNHCVMRVETTVRIWNFELPSAHQYLHWTALNFRANAKCRLCRTSLKIYKQDSCLKDCAPVFVDRSGAPWFIYPAACSLGVIETFRGHCHSKCRPIAIFGEIIPSISHKTFSSLRQRDSLGCASLLLEMETITFQTVKNHPLRKKAIGRKHTGALLGFSNEKWLAVATQVLVITSAGSASAMMWTGHVPIGSRLWMLSENLVGADHCAILRKIFLGRKMNSSNSNSDWKIHQKHLAQYN